VLDLTTLREQPEVVRESLIRRGAAQALGTLERLLAVDSDWRRDTQAAERLKAQRNALSDSVRRARQSGAPIDAIVADSRAVGEQLVALDAAVADAQRTRDELLMQLPNLLLADVPAGGEEANVILRTWGTPRPVDGVRPHWEIGEALGLFDLAAGARLSGSGFIVYRGLGARLVRGLMNWMLALHTGEHGYDEVWVPSLVTRQTMTGTGQLPKFEEDLYRTRDEDLFLIPTAEVPITNLMRDEILEADRLPLALTGYSPCFRREAGSAGKDTRGLLRVHQFDKVEMVRVCAPEESERELELLTGHAEAVLQRLGLPYRVLLLAGGDTGVASAKTYDLEVWAPGVGKWLEVSSCSTFTDFQARRTNIRFRPAGGGKLRFAHTLNGSGLAFPRTIAAILEHWQRPDGTVDLPEPLRPWVGVDRLG